jgi:hypothetical protein
MKTLSAVRDFRGRPLSTASGAWGRVTRLRDGVKSFDWKAAMFATWVFLALCGAIALGIWFAQPMRWLLLAASLFAIAVGWCLTFKIISAARLMFGAPRLPKGPKQPPTMKKVFLYFNPDTGEEVFKMEPVQ